jgi:hypothetical protein
MRFGIDDFVKDGIFDCQSCEHDNCLGCGVVWI